MALRQSTRRDRPEVPVSVTGLVKGRVAGTAATVGLAALGLAGCVTVNAPDKPIVIELNVNIRQEVIYRLAADAGDTIEENADIF